MPPSPLTVQYKEIDGSKIDTDVYLPPLAASDNGQPRDYPVLIDIHGGSFMLGHSKMVCMPQVDDCLARGWIVVSPNHRLCPQVNILEGPMADCRDLLAWIYDDHLDAFLAGESAAHLHGSQYRVDKDRVMAFGTSSGGTLALSLGWDVPRRVAAILDFYAPAYLTHPFWTQPLLEVASKLPPLDPAFLNRIYDEKPVPTNSSISLEGQTEVGVVPGPDFSRPRDGFALTQVANGSVIQACYPGRDVKEIDPVHHVDAQFPPTCIVHGGADTKVTIEVSRELFRVLKEQGVRCEMIEVPGEDHTFAMSMKVGSPTWELQERGFDFLESVIAPPSR